MKLNPEFFKRASTWANFLLPVLTLAAEQIPGASLGENTFWWSLACSVGIAVCQAIKQEASKT